MPIVTFHLVEGRYPPERLDELLERSSTLYARVLDSPLERVRAFVADYPAERVAVAGIPVSRGARPAPYFEFLVLRGRPVAQRHELLAGFTDLLVELLDAPRALIRGRVIQLDSDDWAIAGEPASTIRRAEIQTRAGAGSA